MPADRHAGGDGGTCAKVVADASAVENTTALETPPRTTTRATANGSPFPTTPPSEPSPPHLQRCRSLCHRVLLVLRFIKQADGPASPGADGGALPG